MFGLDSLPLAYKLLIFALSAPLICWIAIMAGRYLKRRFEVGLGTMYSLFCLALAVYLPLKILDLDFPFEMFDLRRELRAVCIVLGAFVLVPLVDRWVWNGYFLKKRHQETPKFLRELVALVIVLVAFMIVLSVIYSEGKAIAGLLAGSGLIAIILGFAMQDLLGNIVSGIALEVGKPFKPGDWLIYDNKRAEVIEVNWRSTRLRTNDEVYLDIPNSQIVKNTIQNLSFPVKQHAERILIGIDYAVPPNVVREHLKKAASTAIGVLLKPAPKVFLKEFGDSAVMYEIKFWMDRDDLYNDVMDSVRTNIWYELDRNNIKIPFPTRTVQVERRRDSSRTVSAAVMESLRKQKFFQCMDAEQIDSLLASAKLQRYGRGETVIAQGAEGNSMYVLVHGTVDVHVNHDGRLTHVATLKAGDYFGEMSLLTGEKRSATVIAGSDSESLRIDKPTFAALLESNPDLFQKLSEMLASRRMETEGILASNAAKEHIATKQEEYAANFLNRLTAFFRV